jgi:DNA-directed RNA polymerase subunit RPC12/RpoP
MTHTRCPYCGIRLPEKYLTEHISIMHPSKARCGKCGSRLMYSQYSYKGYCPNCIKEVEEDGFS